MNVSFVTQWSNELTPDFINDFIQIENQVLYNGFFSQEYFNRKFCENIFGPSILILAYLDKQVIGANALWRNDLNGEESYQFLDSCVLPQYEGYFIFPDMTNKLKSKVDKKCPIYGFPNDQSFPMNVAMGCKIVKTYKTGILCFPTNYSKMHPCKIASDYAKWWIKYRGASLSYVKYFGHYYLVKERRNKYVLYIIGEVDKETAELFRKRHIGLHILTFPKEKKLKVNTKRLRKRVGTHIMSFGRKLDYVPVWKVDAI